MYRYLRRPLFTGLALACLVSLGLTGYTFRLELIHHLGLATRFGWQRAPERVETEWYTARLGGMRGWRTSPSDPDWDEGEYDLAFHAKHGLVLHEVVLKLVEDTSGERHRTLLSIPLLGTDHKQLSASEDFNQQGAIRIPSGNKQLGPRRLIVTAQIRYPASVATASDAAVSVLQDQSIHPTKYRLHLEAWRQ